MFELCLRFFIFQATWNEIKFYFSFCFFKPWILFSRTRGSAGAIANPYTISYCLSTFYFSKLWKNLTSCAFSCGKTCKKYLEFPANIKIARIILFWLHLRVFQGWGLDSWSFYYVACTPMQSETWRHTPCHADAWPGFDNIMQSYALIFCGVEHSSLLGWSVSVTGWAVRSHAVFMWSFLQDRNRAGYAAIRSVNRSVPWLAPI